MSQERVNLYCEGCDKELAVSREDIKRVRAEDPKSLTSAGAGTTLRYSGGCFFKKTALLKRAAGAEPTSGS